MTKKNIFIAAAAMGMLLAFWGNGINAKAAPPAEGNWTLLPAASDEFDRNQLDSTKWNNGIWYDVTTDLAFSPSNVTVRDGNLVLTAKRENYNGKSYTAGAVESKFEVPGTDSYVEVRAKALDKRANVLSAIWMQSSPLSTVMNPNPEIDIMETVDYRKLSSTLHVWPQNPSSHTQMGTNDWDTGLQDISADYHIYGLERRNGKLRFYFDGRLAWEKVSTCDAFVEMSRHMVLSLEGHLGAPAAAYLPGEFLVDYVRTYYDSDFVGIPENGCYYLVNAKSGMLLTVPNSSPEERTQLVQAELKSNNSQEWQISRNDDGTYCIQNQSSGKYVDLKADQSVADNGVPILQYSYHGDSNQRWYVVPTSDGYFRIMSAMSGKALCVKDASLEEEAPIIQWTFENEEDKNDEWMFLRCQ